MPLSPSVFQLPIPTILYLIPPSHSAQWLVRTIFLIYTFTIAIPALAVLVPLSIILAKCNNGRSPVLSLHPDNLPPRVSFVKACERGYLVYTVGTIIWAITGVGNAPEGDLHLSRRLTWLVCRFVGLFASLGVEGRLKVDEEICEPVRDNLRIGALRRGHVKEVVMFSMRHEVDKTTDDPARPDASPSSTRPRAILFLAGGGYVTGTPLAHPFVPSLIRRLPHDRYTVFAPFVRKSLDKSRSFPVPLLDALAAYQHLRKTYEAKDIIVMGDSAGGGMTWSLTAYLAILGESEPSCTLGVPGRCILISPWLSLPPTSDAPYPDWVDTPQLLNAARCYMARYPILRHRPDPFASDPLVWPIAFQQLTRAFVGRMSGAARRILPRRIARRLDKTTESSRTKVSPEIGLKALSTMDDDQQLPNKMHPLASWLDEEIFARLSSHHPLVSPCSAVGAPFVRRVLDTLEQRSESQPEMMVFSGTAEWFHASSIVFVDMVRTAGIEVHLVERKGGFHAEGCVLPGEMGGTAGALVDSIQTWLEGDHLS